MGTLSPPNTMKNVITQAVIAFLVLAATALIYLSFGIPAKSVQGAVADATNIGVATTSAPVTVTTSTRLLATTTNALGNGTSYTRVYATICNPSATLVYVNLNADRPASGPLGRYSNVIGAAAGYSACMEITDRNLTQGSIQASSTNETSTVITVQEYVQ